MPDKHQVLIVSIFGRGHWLAQELASQGFKVALADVSEHMGRWAPEDREGPFGYFRSERLSTSQLERLVSDETSEPVERGFTVWLNDGPLEMKGPVTVHSLRVRGISDECVHYLQRSQGVSDAEREQLKRRTAAQEFSRNWLAHLAHYLAAVRPASHVRAMAATEWPLPVFDTMVLRRSSWRGVDRGLDECRRKGVTVYAGAELLDLAVGQKRVEEIEIRSDVHNGVIRADQVVWMLTSEESLRFSERIHTRLFPQGAAPADRLWMRFRLSIEMHPSLQELPVYFVSLEDHCLDWSSNGNCRINIRTAKETDLDVWTKVPVARRFHRSYLEGLCEKLCADLSKRLGGLKVECLNWPQEYMYEYDEVGAPRFPLFPADGETMERRQLQNLYYDGPENWSGFDWASQFSAQEKIMADLLRWRSANLHGESPKEPRAEV